MDFSEKILNEYTIDADRRLAFSCRLFILFMLLVALLNYVGIFKIDAVPLNITVFISCINFILPTIIYNVLKIHNEWMRYIFITVIVLQSGLQYAVLSYHTIIMLVFPLVIACLYNKKKYVYFAAVLSVPMIIISHLISTVLRVVPDEPLVEVNDVIFFGILPRMIEFFGIAVVCIFISDRIENLVKTLADKTVNCMKIRKI